MGLLNSGRSCRWRRRGQLAIQVSSDRAEALAYKLKITFDPVRARLPLRRHWGSQRNSAGFEQYQQRGRGRRRECRPAAIAEAGAAVR